RIRQECKLCDVTLVVEGKEFPAHRIVLAASSKYFYGLFTSEMIEKNAPSVKLQELRASVMNHILTYLYTGEITVTELNAEDLIASANYLLIPRLKGIACKYLERHMTSSNCIYFYKFGEKYECKDLKFYASQLIKKNFAAVGRSKDFMRLGAKQIEDLIASEDLVIGNEEEVFETVVEWIKYDPEKREDYFADLFRHIRLTSITVSYLFATLVPNPLVKSNPECMAKILEAIKQQHTADAPLLAQRPRKCLEHHLDALLTCGGLGPDGSVRDLTYCYIPSEGSWYELSRMTVKRCRHGLSASCGFIYAIGGKDECFHQSVERFDPKTNTWSLVAPMKRRVKLVGTTSLNGNLYVIGGIEFGSESSRRRCDTVQKYDPTTNVWSLVAPISSRRSSVCAVSDNRYVYSIGGLGDNDFQDVLERYDPKLNTWTKLAPMTEKRGCACGAHFGGKIYVFGGTVDAFSRQAMRSCEVYDIAVDQWHEIAPMRVPRYHAGASLLRDRIYVLGGTGSDSLDSEMRQMVECYNVEKNKW
ncbi:predicted protein, partial [Nematostella vectensis]